ncbi:outer membrane protein [Bacteroides sp. 519]|uniref:outer membrane protein n=1 Tax=Bacteroides sp. 519 TaxID=2302937 RepID=UPI0013D76906|nr:outer membrane beta-barrel protein [Bacteroides sp. 519]NDV59804.1 porin family protein [Bacteroides sp. 519]
MKKENDELFDLFRTRLEHAEVEVRDNFWEQLENDIPVVVRNRRRLLVQRFSAAASVLIILAGVSAAFWHFSPKDEIADAFTKMEISPVAKGNMKNDGIKEELPSIHATPKKQSGTIIKPQSRKSIIEEIDEEESFSFSISMSFSVTEQITENQIDRNPANRLAGGMDIQNNYSEEQSQETTSVLKSKKEKNNSWALGFFSSTSAITGKDSKNGLQMLTAKNNSLNINNHPGAVSRSDFYSEEDYLNYMQVASNVPAEKQHTKLKHKLPISVGITAQKNLSDRFSLETGLVYTKLDSDLTGGKDNTYYQQEQTLHYLGIPLKANYTICDNKHFDLYASAGGMVEKSISGKIKTDYYDAGKHTHSSKQSLTVDPLQLSLTASLGVQYKFNDRVSVYAEPGLAYYFDDGSLVSTIRKEKPLNFNMLCGVRMTY